MRSLGPDLIFLSRCYFKTLYSKAALIVVLIVVNVNYFCESGTF